MRKIICVILALFLASSAAFAGYQIFREYTERQESADTYTDLENLISFPEVLPEEEPDETNLSESGETEPAPVGPTIDFAGLEEINEDCVAWIYIEDTAINYPVVQGSDNSYYLKHLIDGKWNSAGCIFLDSRVDSDISDRHSIIYGHHMKDGTMFSGLTKYKKQDYYEAHPAGLLITPEQTYRIEFFAGYVVSVEDSAWKIGFESDEEFETWIKEAKQRSWFESPFLPQSPIGFFLCLPAAMNSITRDLSCTPSLLRYRDCKFFKHLAFCGFFCYNIYVNIRYCLSAVTVIRVFTVPEKLSFGHFLFSYAFFQ